eukprot:COSAG06_NODE_4676_length_4043_cov_6.020039_6_plen_47_part_00
MFVPSLSWQMFGFQRFYEMAFHKRRFFVLPAREHVEARKHTLARTL